jgi:polyisoprenoid-binding protein YceI
VVKLNHQALLVVIGYGRSMSIPAGTHTLGPANASLKIMTMKGGAASKAGHNLVIEVGTWEATLTTGETGADSNLALSADSRSLRVLEGSGGVKPLTEADRSSIRQTIDEDVLKGCAINFRSTSVTGADGRLDVRGELELAGRRNPVGFTVTVADDGGFDATATVKQTDWGIKPYTALFGALKVHDEVQIVVQGKLGGSPVG